MVEQRKIADKLRVARELMGITQEKAATFLGLPRTAITKIESAERHISSLELTKLAKLYHRSIDYFFNDKNSDDLIVELHRIAPGLDKNLEVKQHVNLCIELCREGVILEKMLGCSERAYLPSYADIISKSAQEAIKHGEHIAKEERRRLGLGSSPIGDIAELIAGQNVWASSANLPANMSGLFIHHESIGLAIFINGNQGHARNRFSIAHEYAHALFDRDCDKTITVSSENNNSIKEKRANAFAAAFLMPEEGVRDLLKTLHKGAPTREEKIIYNPTSEEKTKVSMRSNSKSQQITYQDIAFIAYHFGVSYQAAVYRLLNLSLINQSEGKRLLELEDLGRNYLQELGMLDDLEGKKNKKYKDRELRNQILKLSIEAYRQELISKGRLVDLGKLLSISSETIIGFAEAA